MALPYLIRRATSNDAAVIARHRVLMFYDMGEQPAETAAAVEAETRRQLSVLLATGEYVGWLAETPTAPPAADDVPGPVSRTPPGRVVAGIGVFVRRRMPRHSNPQGLGEAYVLNVYTERAYRRRGLASSLVEAVVDWCREQRLSRIALHASAEGRHVYARFGFDATNELARSV